MVEFWLHWKVEQTGLADDEDMEFPRKAVKYDSQSWSLSLNVEQNYCLWKGGSRRSRLGGENQQLDFGHVKFEFLLDLQVGMTSRCLWVWIYRERSRIEVRLVTSIESHEIEWDPWGTELSEMRRNQQKRLRSDQWGNARTKMQCGPEAKRKKCFKKQTVKDCQPLLAKGVWGTDD